MYPTRCPIVTGSLGLVDGDGNGFLTQKEYLASWNGIEENVHFVQTHDKSFIQNQENQPKFSTIMCLIVYVRAQLDLSTIYDCFRALDPYCLDPEKGLAINRAVAVGIYFFNLLLF